MPAQNALPAPVNTTTATSSSVAAARSASAAAWYSSSLNVLARSGRLNVSRRTRSRSSVSSMAGQPTASIERGPDDRFVADRPPPVVGAALHDGLARAEHDGRCIGEGQLELSREHDVDVDGGGGVPPGFAGVEARGMFHRRKQMPPPGARAPMRLPDHRPDPARPARRRSARARPARCRHRRRGTAGCRRRARTSDRRRRWRRRAGAGPRRPSLVAAICGSPGGGASGSGRSMHTDVGARVVADHPPPVPVAALDHDVAGPELVLAVVETEHDAAVDHHHEVEGVGRVHARLVGIVALDADPLAAALARARESDDAYRAAAGRRFEPDGDHRVRRHRRRRWPAGPSSHSQVATPNPLARIVFGGAPSERITARPSASCPVTTRRAVNSPCRGPYAAARRSARRLGSSVHGALGSTARTSPRSAHAERRGEPVRWPEHLKGSIPPTDRRHHGQCGPAPVPSR